jgi:hypothetical protein
VYTSSVLRGAPYTFFFLYIKFHLLIKKKTKGRREILHLVNSINYGDVSASSRHMKSKAHMV